MSVWYFSYSILFAYYISPYTLVFFNSFLINIEYFQNKI